MDFLGWFTLAIIGLCKRDIGFVHALSLGIPVVGAWLALTLRVPRQHEVLLEQISLDGASLDFADVWDVAVNYCKLTLCPSAREKMARSRAWVLRAAAGEVRDESGASMPVYGVNTGYGSLARVRIPKEKITQLSMNLIRSHAAGVGDAASVAVTRATMLLRANALAKGSSGCNIEIVTTLIAMLNARVTPEIPLQGSVGSSGDLAPLSHLGLVVFDDGTPGDSGWALFEGVRLKGDEAMQRAGIPRIVPGPKDGLAMTNGAQFTTAITALTLIEGAELILAAEIAAALSVEGLKGVSRAFHPAVHALRPYPGAIQTASNLCALLAGSTLVDSIPEKVQDAYSLRCTPMVLGAVRDGLKFGASQVAIELNAATDNPLILMDEPGPNHAFSAGLFHGEAVGLAADHIKLVISEAAALSERRLYRLTTGSLSALLPPLLVRVDQPGMGMMVPQTTAAALVSENRSLCWPSSADSIPTCEDQEDLVAMSTTAARRAAEVLQNSRKVVAIELMAAVTALRVRRDEGHTFGAGSAAAYALLSPLTDARTPSEVINRIDAVIASGALSKCVREAVPSLEVADV
jgi:histidine ammonia-lyase